MTRRILDPRGRELPLEKEKYEAEEKLKEYVAKHKSRFDDWFKAYGPAERPPIKYDLNKKEWVWVGE